MAIEVEYGKQRCRTFGPGWVRIDRLKVNGHRLEGGFVTVNTRLTIRTTTWFGSFSAGNFETVIGHQIEWLARKNHMEVMRDEN